MTSKHVLLWVYGVYAVVITALLIIPKTDLPNFYSPFFMAGVSTAALLIILIPGFFARHASVYRRAVVRRYQAVLALCIAVNGLGGLGLYKLYKVGIQYDKILHFLVSSILVLIAAHFLFHWRSYSATRAVILALVIVIAGGILWEVWEVLQDAVFHTQTAGVYGADYFNDTMFDLIFDVIGSVCGGILLYVDRTRRRIPGLPFSLNKF